MVEGALGQEPRNVALLNTAARFAFGMKQHEKAEAYWQRAVAAKPDFVAAHANLGVLFRIMKRYPESEAAYRRAIRIRPDHVEAHYNLGNLLKDMKRYAEAEVAYRRAMEIKPDYADAEVNLGVLLKELRRFPEAEAAYRRALRIKPGLADVHNNLGMLFCELQRYPEAEAEYRHALTIDPDYGDACNNLGVLFKHLKRREEAEAAYRRALEITPDSVATWNNLGGLLKELGRYAEAEAAYRCALRLQPGYAEAHYNLGILFKGIRRYAEAEAAYRIAIGINPGYADARNNLGILLTELKRYAEAEAEYRCALRIRPDYAEAHNNLGALLKEQKHYSEAEACYRSALAIKPDYAHALGQIPFVTRHACSWGKLEHDDQAVKEYLSRDESGNLPPFSLLSIPRITAREQHRAAQSWAENVYGDWLELAPMVPAAADYRHERLRIGYLSADFHEHATVFLLAGVLESHSRERFAIYGYSYGAEQEDPARARVRNACEVFRDLHRLSDLECARRIAADEIDILVDLKGFTLESRIEISALRPAPVIVSWLGYPGTLGHPRLADYLIGDPTVTPHEHQGHFSEVLALMPHCYQPNDRNREIGEKPTRQQAGLPEQGLVFCSFNQCYKINSETFDVWCRLLLDVPDSVLWLLEPARDGIVNLRAEARARGVAEDRLIFAPKMPVSAHLGRLQLADLALDTYPYASHTTGSDALWAGVPLVTMIGETFASRVAASLLAAVGLPELITRDRDEYFALSKALALDPARLNTLSDRLRKQRWSAPLFDTARFARDLEEMFVRMWAQHQRGAKGPITLAT